MKNKIIMCYGWKENKPFVNIENHILSIGDELQIHDYWIEITKIYSNTNNIECINKSRNCIEQYTLEEFYKVLKLNYTN